MCRAYAMCAVEVIVMSQTLRAAIVFAMLELVVAPLYAQQNEPEATPYELPSGWVVKPTPGILGEPSILTKLAMSTDTRISLGVQTRYQDALAVDYFGLGNDSQKRDQTAYQFKNFDVLASGRVHANRWLTVEGRVGWIPRPDLSAAAGRVI